MHLDVTYGGNTCNISLSTSEHTKFLGVVVDDKLTFSNQRCLHDIRTLPMPISDEITEAHGNGIATA